MALLNPQLPDDFRKSLQGAPTENTALKNVGMVGASVHVFRNEQTREIEESFVEPTEVSFLSAGHNLLLRHGCRLPPDVVASVCDIRFKSDFLAGAFNAAALDFLILSSLYYDPDNLEASSGLARQSPFAGDPENWLKAINDINARAILNIFKSGDHKSGEGIAELIEKTGRYERVEVISDDLVGACDPSLPSMTFDFTGGHLFIRKPIFGL